MRDSNNIDELYTWINSRYEEYAEGNISEEVYLKDLEYYKKRLAETQEKPAPPKKVDESKASIAPTQVRSTSIAGLRKKLMEEMKK